MISLPADTFARFVSTAGYTFPERAINYDGVAALVEYHIREGADGQVLTGTSGEPSTLKSFRAMATGE